MNEHIEEALESFRSSAGRYARSERYYRGDHDLAFATEKFANAFGSLFREFALNLCPAVCDAVRDKLRIMGFEAPEPFRRAAESIWFRNRMAIRAGEAHREAVTSGDAYVIVWPDETGRAAMHPNAAANCRVFYDAEHPGRVLRAAKYWRERGGRTRLNLFYRDRIERYVSEADPAGGLPALREFAEFREGGASVVPNPFGVVPVFHFANNADIGSFGTSELEQAKPIQDGLNKTVLDMLVAMEYCAYRQRWAAGIEIKYDANKNPVAPFQAGVDHLWTSENPNARFGDFNTADLEQFLKVKDGFRIDIASVTGTPMNYLMPHSGSFPSGEALRKAESRFIAKVRDRQAAFGQVWADAVGFALRIEHGVDDVQLTTRWEDPARLTEAEELQNLLLKRQIGLTEERALDEAGYSAG